MTQKFSFANSVLSVTLLALLVAAPHMALAQAKPVEAKTSETKTAEGKKSRESGAFGSFGNSKEPVKIDAGSLQVLDKEQKAIYKGDVVAIQGQTTLRCTILTVFYMQQKDKAGAGSGQSGSAIKKLNCDGPVSVVSTTQTATGDYGVFDAEHDVVTLTGNVVLADCENVQQGDKLVYNTKTGIANVTNNGNRRVQGVFTPGSQDKGSQDRGEAASTKQAGCKDKK